MIFFLFSYFLKIVGVGEFILSEVFRDAFSLPSDEMLLIQVPSLDEIVANMKKNIDKNIADESEQQETKHQVHKSDNHLD